MREGPRRRLAALYSVVAIAGVLTLGDVAGATQANVDHSADWTSLRTWIGMEQSFTAAARGRALNAVEANLANPSARTESSFYMEVRRIVALADNGHSNVSGQPIPQVFGMIPVRVYWFADGLRVVRADRRYRKLLGGRIDRIDGRKIRRVERRLLKFHGGTREMFRRYAAQRLMLSPPILHAIGLADRADELTLTVIDDDGRHIEMTVPGEPGPVSVTAFALPFRYLDPQRLPGEGRWRTAIPASTPMPLYLQETATLLRSRRLRGGTIAYVQLRTNFGPSRTAFTSFLAQTRADMLANPPAAIVFDNRHNPGGDLTMSADFALELPELTEGNVYVITDHATFSAGIYSSFYPEAADRRRTFIVGERVGDASRFWAETGAPFALPSGIGIGYALQLHDVGNGCQAPECHMLRHANPRWNIAVGSLEPEIPAPLTYAAYAAGRDPALEAILEHFDGATPASGGP